MSDFEVFAEWIIRRLREIDFDTADPETIIRWVLYSLGVKDIGIKIYLYLREKKRATTTEIAEVFNISPATARRYLEQLHSLGLVDYIGREYHITREDLSGSIREILIPRIRRVLNFIADIAEHVDRNIYKRDFDSRVTSEDIEDIIERAKAKALRDVKAKIRNIEHITPQMISNIISGLVDNLSKTILESLRPLNKALIISIPRYKKKKFLEAQGLSVTEYSDKIVFEIFEDYTLKPQDLEQAREKGKKIILRVYGNLYIPKDIDPSLGSIIKRLEVYGDLEAPREFIVNVRRLSVYGTIRFI